MRDTWASAEGRRVLVVGASRGSGRATALALAERGARLALLARDQAALAQVASAIRSSGGVAEWAGADVSREVEVGTAVQRLAEALAGLDAVVYCAGVGLYGAVETYSLDDWRASLDVNVTGLFLVCRAALPHLRRGVSPAVVALASGAGKQGYANLAAYSASKFALIGFMQSLAAEVGESGIKVMTLVPGSILTDFGSASQDQKRASGNKYLLPEDVAQAVICLLTQSERAWTQEMNLWPFR